jgi:hypothetical protein
VESAHRTHVQDGQFGLADTIRRRSYYRVLIHEPFEERIDGNTILPGFACDAGFSFTRNFKAHSGSPFRLPWPPILHQPFGFRQSIDVFLAKGIMGRGLTSLSRTPAAENRAEVLSFLLPY